MANYIKEYDQAIKTGKIQACKKIALVYDRLAKETEQEGKYVFKERLATKPIKFIEQFCKQSQGVIGEPINLMLWQKALIQAIFGFVHAETGYRRYKETFVQVARKNGKSTLLSAISLYMLLADKEGGAEVYSVATKLDQSKRILTEAWNMVKQSPDLRAVIKKRRTDMFFPHTASTMQALASSSKKYGWFKYTSWSSR